MHTPPSLEEALAAQQEALAAQQQSAMEQGIAALKDMSFDVVEKDDAVYAGEMTRRQLSELEMRVKGIKFLDLVTGQDSTGKYKDFEKYW